MLFSFSCTEGFFDHQYLEMEFTNLLDFFYIEIVTKEIIYQKLPLLGSDHPFPPTPKFPETSKKCLEDDLKVRVRFKIV